MLALLLCECAGRTEQRSKSIWLKKHWRWIKILWIKADGKAPNNKSTPSQSTLSRFLSVFDEQTFSRLLCDMQRDQFIDKWNDYIKMNKNQQQRRKAKNRKSPRKKTKDRKPHYSFDGKARKGCVSELTGRTEVDVTLFNSDFHQVLAKRTLDEKQGERNGVIEILQSEARGLPSGVITGDAGILCPKTVSEINKAGHFYLMQVKGNAGEAFNEIRSLPWGKVQVKFEAFNEGHGRREIRSIKSIPIELIDSDELDKYFNLGAVFEVETWIHHIKEDKYTKELSYYIGDQSVAEMSLESVLHYRRLHWTQESYHWIKDAILKEDDSWQKKSNGSRTLGSIRSYVSFVGKQVFGSVKSFLDHFTADPENVSKKL